MNTIALFGVFRNRNYDANAPPCTKEWIPYCKKPFQGAESVIKYLGKLQKYSVYAAFLVFLFAAWWADYSTIFYKGYSF